MALRPNINKQRRIQIIEAAQNVFARLGFHKARMDDIAQEAGVSKGTLYWYYKSKDALITAILERIFSLEMRYLEKTLATGGPAAERLRHLGQESVHHVLRLDFLAPIALEFYALAARNQAVRNALRGYYTAYRQTLARLVQEGVEAGEFETGTRADAVSQTLIAAFEGHVLLWVVDPENTRLDEDVRTTFETVISSIQAKSRP